MRQSDSLPVLLGKPAVPLIGFRDKDVVGGWLFISQWETYILICVIKIQPGALGCCCGGGWELAGTGTGLGSCSALKCLQSLLIKGQAHKEAS